MSPTKRIKIIDCYKLDYLIFSIYQSFVLFYFIVYFIINKYKNKEDPNFRSKPRLGATPALSSRGEKRLIRHATIYIKNILFAFYLSSKSGK
jgi:hypothetical protein